MYQQYSINSNESENFECGIYNKVYDFNNKYDILYEHQFSSRRKYFTNHAIITLETLDSREMVIGVFPDLKKSFNTLRHSILPTKFI